MILLCTFSRDFREGWGSEQIHEGAQISEDQSELRGVLAGLLFEQSEKLNMVPIKL